MKNSIKTKKINKTSRTGIIGLKEFRQNADKYISRISKGESFTVLKRSHPVFKMTPVDEYVDEDDDGNWETVVDFTKIKKGGVPAEDVISAIESLYGQSK
jgi:antitoxin (DNA-binding transcriptional repressor) of toxin-antitoxin stability system